MSAQAIATLDGATVARLEEIVEEFSLLKLVTLSPIAQAAQLALGYQQLRQALTAPVMAPFMALMNTPLGFLTDRPNRQTPTVYPVEEVRDAMIEALIRGFWPVNNEFNVISKRFYATRNGLRRKVREFPGLTDLEKKFSVPLTKNGGAVVSASASWKLNGVEQRLEREIPIRVNEGMGADAILGKADRKLLAAIYDLLTGSEFSIPDAEVGDVIEEKLAGSGATDAARSVGMPSAKKVDPGATGTRPAEDLDALDALAAVAGFSPIELQGLSSKMFNGKAPAQLNDAEFATLQSYLQNGPEGMK